MKYEFRLDDYDEIMDQMHERPDIYNRGIAEIKIDEEEGSELYARGLRVYIPELNISVRMGTEWYIREGREDDEEADEPMDSVIIYSGDEKDISKYEVSWCNCTFEGIIKMIAANKGLNINPMCYIDDSEIIYDC